MEQFDFVAWMGHGLSIGALIGAITGFVTPVAAVATTVWFSVQVLESKTVQRVLRARRARRITRLQSKLDELRVLQTIEDEG